MDPLLPALAVLAAGALHAVWNAIAKAIPDRYAAMALIGVAQAALGALSLLLVAPPAAGAWPWLALSVPVQVAYVVLLARCYEIGDFGQVYPLARGSAPLLVALVAATALGEHLSVVQLAGLAAVCGGLGVLALAGSPTRATTLHRGAVTAALLTGVAIAGYTLLDGVGVRRSGTALGYAAWGFAFQGPAVLLTLYLLRGRTLLTGMRKHWKLGLTGGVISVSAYSTVLWVQTKAALATVAALRETGVIVGVVIGALFFSEPLGRRRLAAASTVALGVVLINASGVR